MNNEIAITFQQTIMSLLLTLITVVSPIAVYYVKQFVDQKLAALKAVAGERRWFLIQSIASTVVSAAEQSGLIGAISEEGAAKKSWALAQLKLALVAHGITQIDPTVLSAAIEGAVHDANQPIFAQADFEISPIKELQ